jgi:uncharacterized protein (TIGR03437 family)
MNRCAVRVLFTLWFIAANSFLPAQTLSFLHPLPNPASLETSTAIAADKNGVYVTGVSRAGVANALSDAFLRKYDSTGALVFERTFGGPAIAAGVKTLNGDLYVAGQTGWNISAQAYYVLPGQEGKGLSDVFLRRYDSNGNEIWTRQFGGEGADVARGIAVDSTGIYVAGNFGDLGPGQPFLRKYDSNGNELWTQKLTYNAVVAADALGVYTAGSVAPSGDRKQWTGTVSRYDSSGAQVWSKDFESEAFLVSIEAGGGGVYVSGNIALFGSSFVRKYGSNGNVLWTRPLPSQSGTTVAMDTGSVYVSGAVTQTLPGQCAAGADDAYVKAFDFDGGELWTRQLGSYYGDVSSGLAVDAGSVYLLGTQMSAEYYPSVQRTFLAKLVPESSPAGSSTPRIQAECVLNAASYIGGAVAPGEIVTILGSNLGPSSALSFNKDKDGRVPALLGETRVLFNGVAAPVLSASASQVMAIVPVAIADSMNADVQVDYKGVRSQAVTLPVLASRPGVFSLEGSGSGQAAAVNQDGTLNSHSNPAPRGSIVALYVTGLGVTDPPLPDGQVVSGVGPRVNGPVSVVFTNDGYIEDGVGAGGVYYAGGVDGFVQGLAQVNVQTPTASYFPGGRWAPQVVVGDAWTFPIQAVSNATIWIQ